LGDSSALQFSTGTNVMTVTGNIQLNGTSGVGSLTGNGSISMTGNVSGANLEAVSGGLIKTTGNANVGNLNATSGIYGTIQTASQTNITSVGTLGTLTVSGKSNLNAIGNVYISGGMAGQVITTDGAGNLSFSTNDSTQIVNGTSNVSIPTTDGNVLIVSGGTTVIEVAGLGANITGYVDVTGDINANNITANLTLTVDGVADAIDATTGSIHTEGGISAKGNIYAGHSVGFANNNGGTTSKAYIQYNSTADSLDFIFN
jgi:hypothetical protein